MLNGDSKSISNAANNMLANLAGMFCDGAKESCAFKLSTSAAESILMAYLAKIFVKEHFNGEKKPQN